MNKSRVLIVDDEADIRELLSLTLQRMGLDTDCAASESEAVQLMQKQGYDLCLTDMRLPDGDGLKLLAHIGANYASTPVAVITAYGSAENAVAALKAGAFDYLAKPVSLKQLRALVHSALKLSSADQQRKGTEGGDPQQLPQLLGESKLMMRTRQTIDKLARSQAPIHISGESGSGKELAARLMHLKGPRREAPFVPVNCGAIPENLMESEFFGYKKGAFTGANQDRDGFFQAANGGTLFLDEVADLPIQMQVKLLRAIQEKKVRKVGSTSEEHVDVRIISATHRSLADEVENGMFRQDLFYRLNVIELRMPALREIREDIPLLAAEILKKLVAPLKVAPPRLSFAALKELQSYGFPGNVRQLENILERALALTTSEEIKREDLQLSQAPGRGDRTDLLSAPLPERLEDLEKKAIMQALEKTRYNRTAAAKLLGITFRALRYKMEKLGINDALESND
ncbi:MAG: sigma-54 dependent transcriptional regulator [Pseudomonadota bacterium]